MLSEEWLALRIRTLIVSFWLVLDVPLEARPGISNWFVNLGWVADGNGVCLWNS